MLVTVPHAAGIGMGTRLSDHSIELDMACPFLTALTSWPTALVEYTYEMKGEPGKEYQL